MLLCLSFRHEPNKGHVGAGKGTEVESWLQLCVWDTISNTLVTFHNFNIIDLSIHVRNWTQWNGLKSYRLEVFIDSLAFFWSMLIALHPIKTCYRLGDSSLSRSLIIGKNIIGKDFNKFVFWMFLARFSLWNTPVHACNNFLSKWHITTVLVYRSVIRTIVQTPWTGIKPSTPKNIVF